MVLLDLRMPKYDGLWLLHKLQEQSCDIPVLVLTTFDDDTLVLDALRAGARGYLLKDVTVDQLAQAVHALANGGTLIAPPSQTGWCERSGPLRLRQGLPA